MPFGHTSPAPFGGTLPKGEGLGVTPLNNHLRRGIWGSAMIDSLGKVNGMDDIRGCRPEYLNHPEGIPQFAEGKHHIA